VFGKFSVQTCESHCRCEVFRVFYVFLRVTPVKPVVGLPRPEMPYHQPVWANQTFCPNKLRPSVAYRAPAAALSAGSLPAPRTYSSSNHREFAKEGQKERGARQPHKRLLYYFNVNRTSLDHLLLGKNADVDKNVECPEYTAASGEMSEQAFPQPMGLATPKPLAGKHASQASWVGTERNYEALSATLPDEGGPLGQPQ